MTNELVHSTEPMDTMPDVAIERAPDIVLGEASKAAAALADVVKRKKKPVMFGGEQYLEYEDWQTVGRFYGLTARVVKTAFLEMGNVRGYEATAEVIMVSNGQPVSNAEAMCMNDEPNWAKKPLFQLRSMAQTRACAKAFRNVLAWVVVLAGYKPTPAEEMIGTFIVDTPTPKLSKGEKPKDEVPSDFSNETAIRLIAANISSEYFTKDETVNKHRDAYTTFDPTRLLKMKDYTTKKFKLCETIENIMKLKGTPVDAVSDLSPLSIPELNEFLTNLQTESE